MWVEAGVPLIAVVDEYEAVRKTMDSLIGYVGYQPGAVAVPGRTCGSEDLVNAIASAVRLSAW